MTANLSSLIEAMKADRGLKADNPALQIQKGLAAANTLNDVLLQMIALTAANDDGRIDAGDMKAISVAIFDEDNAVLRTRFLDGHGNDAGRTTGFHHIQNDGGTLVFQGHAFIDTVADAIYHFGFEIRNGRYYNEDGNDNETAVDVAGWLNYFLNGVNIIYGSDGNDELGSGAYSDYFAKARSETFMAGDGRDKIWADIGNDKVWAGQGNDMSGGGKGHDRMYGEAGQDTLWGDQGNDRMFGGSGDDILGGGDGNDAMHGDDDHDVLYGDVGYDRLFGGEGRDELSGSIGNDKLFGDGGSDKLYGGEGADRLNGGAGADHIYLWEEGKSADTIVFAPGDAGGSAGGADTVEGFDTVRDKIDMTAFGDMSFRGTDFAGNGAASCRFADGWLLIDADGDRLTDMRVEFTYVSDLRASDFIFA